MNNISTKKIIDDEKKYLTYLKKLNKHTSHFPRFKEECGVFGISGSKDAAALTALGLHALQHRGQEGCGIVTYDLSLIHISEPTRRP